MFTSLHTHYKLKTTYSLELDPDVKLNAMDFMRGPEKDGVMRKMSYCSVICCESNFTMIL